MKCYGALFTVALSMTLFGCATAPEPAPDMLALSAAGTPGPGGRDLTPDEKKVIVDAVAAAIKDPASAKYRWSKYGRGGRPGASENYCAMVNAKSQYGPYSGLQAYVVSVSLTNGRITSAVVGAIAGGKDIPVIRKICQRYGLDPNDAV